MHGDSLKDLLLALTGLSIDPASTETVYTTKVTQMTAAFMVKVIIIERDCTYSKTGRHIYSDIFQHKWDVSVVNDNWSSLFSKNE